MDDQQLTQELGLLVAFRLSQSGGTMTDRELQRLIDCAHVLACFAVSLVSAIHAVRRQLGSVAIRPGEHCRRCGASVLTTGACKAGCCGNPEDARPCWDTTSRQFGLRCPATPAPGDGGAS